MEKKTNGKKTLPAIKVNGKRQSRVVTKGERQSKKKNQKHDNEREREHLTSEDKNVEVVCGGKGEKGPLVQKRAKKRLTLKIKPEEVPSDNGKNSLQSPREKDYDAVSPKCRSSKKNKGSTNDHSSDKCPSSKLETVSRTDATSQKPSKVKSLGPEVTNENEDGKRSPQSPGRKKGLVQEAIFLKSAPSSPIAGERLPHSPTQGNKTNNRPIKPSSARRTGFACESKNEGKDSAEMRREALCSTTDQFGSERRAVRILRKKF